MSWRPEIAFGSGGVPEEVQLRKGQNGATLADVRASSPDPPRPGMFRAAPLWNKR
jgi:hypothetical protein